jgi:hypothetical protein
VADGVEIHWRSFQVSRLGVGIMSVYERAYI